MARTKTSNDLTLMYITANEMPESWMQFQIETLQDAAGDIPIVSVSRKFLNLGVNLTDDGPHCYWNIYMQMLRAAKIAKTTFVAMVEDDTLYTRQHFTDFRPPLDAVSYDRSRWSLFAWDPLFCLRQRISNCSLIAPRQLLIDALEERKEKYPNGNAYCGEVGREKVERRLGVTVHKCVEWWCDHPIVMLNHSTGTDQGDYGYDRRGRHMVKKHGQIKAIEIPFWGTARSIVKIYNPELPTPSEA